MQFLQLSRAEAGELLRREYGLGSLPLGRSDYAEWIRRTVLDLAPLSRAQLVRNILGYGDLIETSDEMLVSTLDELVRRGDVVQGKRALLYPAPCRVVQTAENCGILLGSMSRDHLFDFPGTIEEEGAGRVFRSSNHDALEHWLVEVGGRTVDASAWSGLERAPAADSSFLQQVETRPASHFSVDNARWFFCETARWLPAEDSTYGLWRQRTELYSSDFFYGTPEFARQIPFDDAVRVQHALVRQSRPYRADVSFQDNAVTLCLPCRIPWAEYRHLSLHARAQDDRTLVFSVRDWPTLRALLIQRLGIEFDEVTI